jgi:hypothetical protein
MKKYTLSLLTLGVALSSGAAFAGIVGDASEKSVHVPFAETSIVGHTLTHVSGLQPGDNANNIIAKGEVTTDNSGYINVAFTGSTGTTGSGTVHKFDGNVPTNNIWVSLKPVNGNLLEAGGPGDYTGSIRLKPDVENGNTFSYTINVDGSNKNVAADTYTISVKAHRWAT